MTIGDLAALEAKIEELKAVQADFGERVDRLAKRVSAFDEKLDDVTVKRAVDLERLAAVEALAAAVPVETTPAKKPKKGE